MDGVDRIGEAKRVTSARSRQPSGQPLEGEVRRVEQRDHHIMEKRVLRIPQWILWAPRLDPREGFEYLGDRPMRTDLIHGPGAQSCQGICGWQPPADSGQVEGQ